LVSGTPPSRSSPPRQVELERLEALARELEAGELAQETRDLLLRAEEGRFHLAVLGQFKRGKSTLLNALVGTRVLPMGVTPVTSVPTVIRWGPLSARIRRGDAEWHSIPIGGLGEYVSEAHNPGNRKGVGAVEVFIPHPLLEHGLCLVDTPGIGSTFEANTLAARAFIPHVDAALVVLGTDPPITIEELRLIEEVRGQVGDVVFVLNKWDRLTPVESEEARRFTVRVLADHLGDFPGTLFGVSALAALEGTGDTGEWGALVARLSELSRESAGRALLAAATGRGLARVGGKLRRLIDLELGALQRPLEETDQRIRTLQDLQAEAERALADLQPLLLAEEHRLVREFEERRRAYLARVAPAAEAELEAILRQRAGRIPRKEALEVADAIAEARLGDWLAESEREAELAYRASLQRFVNLVRSVARRLPEESGLEGEVEALEEEAGGLTARREFAFTHLMAQHHHIAPLVWLGDRVLPDPWRARRIAAASTRYLAALLFVNASRVEGDLAQRVRESRRALEDRIRRALAQAARSAAQAAARAQAIRAAGTVRVAERVAFLVSARTELERLTGSGPAG
jgi:hypothetical protein